MKQEIIKTKDILKDDASLELYPEEVQIYTEDNFPKTEVDIILPTYNNYQLCNQTIINYLKQERKIDFKIIVVDTGGSLRKSKKIINHDKVFKIIYNDDPSVKPPKYRASNSLALAASIGLHYSHAPYVFISHDDMFAYKENFLTYLFTKLDNNTRIASFTQRHFIPFTGCMLFKREAFEESKYDLRVYDNNPFANHTGIVQSLIKAGFDDAINWMDFGESVIYNEMMNHRGIYVAPSVGFNYDYWLSPLDNFKISRETFFNILKEEDVNITYGHLNSDKNEFDNKYSNILEVSQSFALQRNKRKYWRYCFDDTGELSFAHIGRGTSFRQNKRWLKFIKKFNGSIK